MTKPLIAVDVDDVLADSAAGLVAFSNQRWGTNLTPADYTERWDLMWQIDHAPAMQRAATMHESGMFGRFAHNEAARPVLAALAERYRLCVVTSRRTMLSPETLAWLDQHFSGIFDNVHFAGMWDDPNEQTHTMTKAGVLAEISADYLIDDQLKHCEAAAAQGMPAILFGNYPWNQVDVLPELVTRADTWTAVAEYFDGRNGR